MKGGCRSISHLGTSLRLYLHPDLLLMAMSHTTTTNHTLTKTPLVCIWVHNCVIVRSVSILYISGWRMCLLLHFGAFLVHYRKDTVIYRPLYFIYSSNCATAVSIIALFIIVKISTRDTLLFSCIGLISPAATIRRRGNLLYYRKTKKHNLHWQKERGRGSLSGITYWNSREGCYLSFIRLFFGKQDLQVKNVLLME